MSVCRALGMGGTRGRIYIKHADLFKVNTLTHTMSLNHCTDFPASQDRVEVLLLVYKSLNDLGPKYMSELLTLY